MILYIILFVLCIAGVGIGYRIGKKEGFNMGWNTCFIMYSTKLRELAQDIYDKGKEKEE